MIVLLADKAITIVQVKKAATHNLCYNDLENEFWLWIVNKFQFLLKIDSINKNYKKICIK